MAEWIMKEEKDMDGVDCYIRKGELIRCRNCIKKELCSIFRDARQECGFCAWAKRRDNDTAD